MAVIDLGAWVLFGRSEGKISDHNNLAGTPAKQHTGATSVASAHSSLTDIRPNSDFFMLVSLALQHSLFECCRSLL